MRGAGDHEHPGREARCPPGGEREAGAGGRGPGSTSQSYFLVSHRGLLVLRSTEAPAFDNLAGELNNTFDTQWAKLVSAQTKDAEPAVWRSRLAAYDHPCFSRLPLTIDGVKTRLVHVDKIAAEARKLTEQMANQRVAGSFEEAWQGYHAFLLDYNQDEVLDRIRDAFMRSAQYVSPMNLSRAVSMFSK